MAKAKIKLCEQLGGLEACSKSAVFAHTQLKSIKRHWRCKAYSQKHTSKAFAQKQPTTTK